MCGILFLVLKRNQLNLSLNNGNVTQTVSTKTISKYKNFEP
jgi:hypothetical protein